MVTIESTAAMAASIYETMSHNLDIARARLGRPLTLADKILLGHLAEPQTQALERGESYLFLKPDRGDSARCAGADRHAAVYTNAPRSSRCAHHHPLRPPDSGPC